MTTQLIKNTTLQSIFPTQLPDHLLYSEDFYCTKASYDVLLNFTDDNYIQELFDSNQLSDGACQDIDEEIDRLFKRDGCPNVFSGEILEELRSYISQKLAGLNLNTVIIK